MQIQLLEEQDIFYRHLLSTWARIAACCTSVARALRCKAEHAGQYLHTGKTATRTSRSCSRWELRLCGADLLLTSHCHYTVSQLLVAARSSVSCDVRGSVRLFALHCGATGQCKDSGVGNRGIHLFRWKRCLCALRMPTVKQPSIIQISISSSLGCDIG